MNWSLARVTNAKDRFAPEHRLELDKHVLLIPEGGIPRSTFSLLYSLLNFLFTYYGIRLRLLSKPHPTNNVSTIRVCKYAHAPINMYLAFFISSFCLFPFMSFFFFSIYVCVFAFLVLNSVVVVWIYGCINVIV